MAQTERVHHLKMLIKIKPRCDEGEVWPIRNRILDMHRAGMSGWPEKLKVQVRMNPRKKQYVTEMGKLWRCLEKMNVTEYVKAEWEPSCSIAKIERTGEIFATFRTSTGLKIDEKILQGLMPGMSVAAERLRNDRDDTD